MQRPKILTPEEEKTLESRLASADCAPALGSETCEKCGQPGAEYEVRLPEYEGKRYHAPCCPEFTPYPGD